jgi:hypothetical protein
VALAVFLVFAEPATPDIATVFIPDVVTVDFCVALGASGVPRAVAIYLFAFGFVFSKFGV